MNETADSIRTFVLGLVEAKARLPAGTKLDGFNYIDAGYVDSIGMIKFVLSIEKQYGVELSEAEMLTPEFRTVGGLVAMIAEKLGGNG